MLPKPLSFTQSHYKFFVYKAAERTQGFFLICPTLHQKNKNKSKVTRTIFYVKFPE